MSGISEYMVSTLRKTKHVDVGHICIQQREKSERRDSAPYEVDFWPNSGVPAEISEFYGPMTEFDPEQSLL